MKTRILFVVVTFFVSLLASAANFLSLEIRASAPWAGAVLEQVVAGSAGNETLGTFELHWDYASLNNWGRCG